MGSKNIQRKHVTYAGVKAAIVLQHRLGWRRFVEETI